MKAFKTTLTLFIALLLVYGIEANAYQEEYNLVFNQPECQSFQYMGNNTPEVYLYYLENTPLSHQIFYQSESNNPKLIEICVGDPKGVEKSTAYVAVVGDGKMYTVPLYYVSKDIWTNAKTWFRGGGIGNIIIFVGLPLILIGCVWVWRNRNSKEVVEE